MLKRLVLVVLGVFVLLVLAGMLLQVLDPDGVRDRRLAAEASGAATATARSVPTVTPLPKPAPATTPGPPITPTPPTVGGVQRAGNWEIGLTDANLTSQIGSEQAQGVFLVITVDATNLHKEVSVLNDTDFRIETADGTKFRPSTSAGLALAGQGNGDVLTFIGPQIQPGLKKRLQMVFDVNPAQTGFRFIAAEIPFRLPDIKL